MTVKETLKRAYRQLQNANFALKDADIILAHVLQKDISFLYAHPEYVLTEKQKRILKSFVNRRLRHEPIEYLTHGDEFYGFKLFIDQRVLIPQPDTEILVDTVLHYCRTHAVKKILEIGTGSGCVAIALAKNVPGVQITATDVSAAALNVAKKNARQHAVSIIFKKSNILNEFKKVEAQVIVANLPYLPRKKIKKFSREVRYQPNVALFGGPDGLKYFRSLCSQLSRLPHPQLKAIFLEIGHDQAVTLQKIIRTYFPLAAMKITKDLAGRNRILTILNSA